MAGGGAFICVVWDVSMRVAMLCARSSARVCACVLGCCGCRGAMRTVLAASGARRWEACLGVMPYTGGCLHGSSGRVHLLMVCTISYTWLLAVTRAGMS